MSIKIKRDKYPILAHEYENLRNIMMCVLIHRSIGFCLLNVA